MESGSVQYFFIVFDFKVLVAHVQNINDKVICQYSLVCFGTLFIFLSQELQAEDMLVICLIFKGF